MKPSSRRQKYIHYNIPGDPHGLSFSCYRNRNFLNHKRTRLFLVDAILKAKEKHNFHVWAYVIMPEHVHLLMFPRNERYSISDILKSVKQSVARRAIHHLRKTRPEILDMMEIETKHHYRFWQDGGGYDRNIRDHEELVRFIEYIHDNPVRRGLVENPEQWFWSSARQWLSSLPGPISIDRESFPIT